MCGINGIFAYGSNAPRPSLEELVATRNFMHNRGPDGEGAWASAGARCLLGHRRLAIIDLNDRSAQPLAIADGSFVATYNGEIYNHRELRQQLEAQGVRFRTSSDTEVLLHLYAREGEDMLLRLRGMFAFAMWDAAREGLFLARDPYGIKPLYTADDGGTFRFASQVKALLEGKAVSRDQDSAGLAGFHLFGSVPEPFTLYRGISALPAGHSQWIDRGGPREARQYYNIADAFAVGAASDKAIDSELAAAVLDSVRAHLVSDVEVGLFLSAGIDSCALLGLMREAGQRDVRAITLGFDEFAGTQADEIPFAGEIAERYGAEHVVRRVNKSEFDEDLPKILEAMDQPSIDGVNTWFVAKAARESGLKVALSGLGSDELLAGYSSFRDVPRWRRRFGPVARIPGAGRVSRWMARSLWPELAREKPKALGMLDHAGSWGGAYMVRRGIFLPHELASILGPERAKEGLQRLSPVVHLNSALNPDPGSPAGRVSVLESTFYMRNQLLRDADWAGMAHSIEIRVPFVDRCLLETLAPYARQLAAGNGKRALAMAPVPPLPASIRERAKSGFAVPTDEWVDASAVKVDETLGHRVGSRRWSRAVLERVSRNKDASGDCGPGGVESGMASHPPKASARAVRSLRKLSNIPGWQRLAEALAGTESDATFLVENSGIKFEGRLDSFIDRRVYLFGGYEEQNIKAFLDLIPAERRNIALDVGANVGTHALRFAQHFNQVHAFEPNPEVFRQLQRNAHLNRFPLAIHPVGLADCDALLDFHLTEHPNSGLGTFLKDEQYDVPLRVMGKARVVRADDYLESCSIGRIDAVKIDTQGFEPAALRGMRNILRDHRPFVWLEVGISTMNQLGSRELLGDLVPYPFELLQFEVTGLVRATQLVVTHDHDLGTRDYVVAPL